MTVIKKAQGSPGSTLFCPCVLYAIDRLIDDVRYYLSINKPRYPFNAL